MKEHIKRRIEYSKDAMPEKGTAEYDNVQKMLEEYRKRNPNLKRESKQKKQ